MNYTQGLAKLDHRERVLDRIGKQETLKDAIDGSSSDEEELHNTAPEAHHQMPSEAKHKVDLATWLHENRKDPACKVRHDDFCQFIAFLM